MIERFLAWRTEYLRARALARGLSRSEAIRALLQEPDEAQLIKPNGELKRARVSRYWTPDASRLRLANRADRRPVPIDHRQRGAQ